MPIHDTYGLPSLPELQVVRLEENIAEKISRLGRTPTARDLYDLAWLVTHQRDIGHLDTDLIGRLVVLKIWVDAHGVTAGTVHWRAGHQPRPFDPDHCAIPTSGRLRNPLRVVVEQVVGPDIQCGCKGSKSASTRTSGSTLGWQRRFSAPFQHHRARHASSTPWNSSSRTSSGPQPRRGLNDADLCT